MIVYLILAGNLRPRILSNNFEFAVGRLLSIVILLVIILLGSGPKSGGGITLRRPDTIGLLSTFVADA